MSMGSAGGDDGAGRLGGVGRVDGVVGHTWGSLRAWRAEAAVPLSARMVGVLVGVSAIGVLAFAWPLLVGAGSALVGGPDGQSAAAPFVLALVLGVSLVVMLVAVSDGGLDVRAIALLGVLSGVGAIIRPISAGTGGVETVFILLVLAGRVFGPGFGFLLGVGTLFTSAVLTGGVGPWLPYQMLAAAWFGLGAGLLPGRGRVRGGREILLLCAYGALAAVGYGVVMNLASWPFLTGVGTGVSFVAGDGVGENLARFFAYSIVTSLPWDLTRALTTVIGVGALGVPVLAVLRRGARRAVFVGDRDTPK